MRRALLLAILVAFDTLGPAHVVRAGDITYNFVSYDSLQNGYTLSGSITTDGTIGSLGSTDITAFTYTISNATTTYTLDQNTPGAYVDVSGLTASATQLLVPPPTTAVEGLSLQTNDALDGYLLYGRVPASPQDYDLYSSIGFMTNNFSWFDQVSIPPGLTLGGRTWVIAQTAVPEPASLTLALLGGACVAVFETTRRRRQSKPRPQAGPTARS